MADRGEVNVSPKEFDDTLVSVITPVYNASKYLEEMIESVLAQTYKNIEMIFVDDCSSDGSGEIIKKYTEKHTNITYYRQEKNMGAAVARNKALELAKGRYVAFLDSDDVWKPNKILRQLYVIKKTGTEFCFTAIEIINGRSEVIKEKRKIKRKVDYNYLLHNTVIPTSSVVIDRCKMGDFRMPLRRGGQDYATWLMLLRSGGIAYGIDEALTQYRIDGKSLSSNKFKSIKQVWEIQTQDEGIMVIKVFFNVFWFGINALKKYFM